MFLLRLPSSGRYVSSPTLLPNGAPNLTDNPNLAACYSMGEAFAAAPAFGAEVVAFSSADLAWRAARAADASPAVASRVVVRTLRSLPGGPLLPGGRPGARVD